MTDQVADQRSQTKACKEDDLIEVNSSGALINGGLARPFTEPSSFTRRQVIQSAVALAASSLVSARESAADVLNVTSQIAENPQPRPTGILTSVSLTVTDMSVASIGTEFVGFSYEKSALREAIFDSSNRDLTNLFKRLGPGILRIGGNMVDQNVWNPRGTGRTADEIAPSNVDALTAFVKATGWRCLYGVNLEGAATGATTPTLAAAEVAYVAKDMGTSLFGIEIGNECDFYGNTGRAFAGKWSLSEFLTLWNQFRDAILASTPGVQITGPASAKNVSNWTIPFGQAVTGSKIAVLTQHYYRANGKLATSTADFLITPDSALVDELATLKAAADRMGIPYRMAECNSFSHGGSDGVSNTYASSLWVIDYLFDCAYGGASGVNFHGGGNGAGYTPIADFEGRVVEVRPEYYGILLFMLSGQGTLYATHLAADSLNTTAYAVKTPSGKLNLVVVNKDKAKNIELTADLPAQARSAALLVMTQGIGDHTAPNLEATTGITVQGVNVAKNGAFSPLPPYTFNLHGSRLTFYVPALSAVLVQID